MTLSQGQKVKIIVFANNSVQNCYRESLQNRTETEHQAMS